MPMPAGVRDAPGVPGELPEGVEGATPASAGVGLAPGRRACTCIPPGVDGTAPGGAVAPKLAKASRGVPGAACCCESASRGVPGADKPDIVTGRLRMMVPCAAGPGAVICWKAAAGVPGAAICWKAAIGVLGAAVCWKAATGVLGAAPACWKAAAGVLGTAPACWGAVANLGAAVC
mmetsp:Transcript_36456/g.97586  ORF Transcript_36456/g.97586 Transcript_36456/m.97586 type:complete len:176 (-) Transcript_36456:357-884(-)